LQEADLIGFSAVAKRVQDYRLAKNIVPQEVFSPADTPLFITGLEPGKLIDLVLLAAVVKIFSKDRQQFFHCVQKGMRFLLRLFETLVQTPAS